MQLFMLTGSINHLKYIILYIIHRMAFVVKCGHTTHHSKAKNVGITHLGILIEKSGYFFYSLFQWLCRWSCDLFQTKIESADF